MSVSGSGGGGGRSEAVIPGAHPSSEGKRRRNRSNVEAMAAKHNNPETGDQQPDPAQQQENHRDLSTNGEYLRLLLFVLQLFVRIHRVAAETLPSLNMIWWLWYLMFALFNI